MSKMTVEQAMQVIIAATGSLNANRQTHESITAAIHTVQEALAAKKTGPLEPLPIKSEK